MSGDVGGVGSMRWHTSWPRDWSSDVCSSDLGGVGVGSDRPPDPQELPRTPGPARPSPVIDRAKTLLDQVLLQIPPPGGARRGQSRSIDQITEEIGRASCRE